MCLNIWIHKKTNDLQVFRDLFVAKYYPYEGFEYISRDETHDIHIMIQRKGSTFIIFKTIDKMTKRNP